MKWIKPEKRLKKYPKRVVDPNKVDWTKFKIVVPTEKDRDAVQAALEYLHDRDIDTDFIAVNQLVHEYPHGDATDNFSNVVVDKKTYDRLNKNYGKEIR